MEKKINTLNNWKKKKRTKQEITYLSGRSLWSCEIMEEQHKKGTESSTGRIWLGPKEYVHMRV